MKRSDRDQAMLDGGHGDAKRIAMEGLIQLGEAFDAADLVDIGYAHIHAGMAMYLHDVELMETLAAQGAQMAVPASSNIANADMHHWQQTQAPENLVQLQRRAETAHRQLGSSCSFTCTPYWAGHWPTWNTHMASIESGVTVFCNSVLGARSNRDGFFAVYAGITGRYPRFGYHLDANRRGTHQVNVAARLSSTTDFTALGFAVGRLLNDAVPVFTGFSQRPSLDDLDALGVGLATSGAIAMFIIPDITPPIASLEQACHGRKPQQLVLEDSAIASVYDQFSDAETFDIVHVGCPHASFEEMKHYARLLDGKQVSENIALWITTSRSVRQMAQEAGILSSLQQAGAKVIADTCPISCHFARTTSPDPTLGFKPQPLRGVVVDSAKQAKYVRDMIACPTLLTDTERALATAISGHFVPRYG